MSTTTKATTTKTTTRTKLSWHRSNRIYRGRYNRSKSTFCPSFVIKREKNHQHHHHIHSHYHGHHIGCYEIESALCSALSCTRNSNNNNNNDNNKNTKNSNQQKQQHLLHFLASIPEDKRRLVRLGDEAKVSIRELQEFHEKRRQSSIVEYLSAIETEVNDVLL